ncbi:hypothetical protein K8R33_01255 [archaeon]|nr:hypothetical protein [archaeon]
MVEISKNKKTLFVGLLMISLILVVPLVESSFVEDFWFGVTGFFSKLITGMAGGGGICDYTCRTACSGSEVEVSGICVDPNICCRPKDVCGDGFLDSGEVCEGGNLNGETCASQGFDSGTLACSGDCTFDTGGCVDSSSSCGDGVCDEGENCGDCPGDCEGVIGSPACASGEVCNVVFGSGSCDVADPSCGDGVVDGNEVCDKGSNIESVSDDVFPNEETCITEGFDSGNLACSSNCLSFDTSGCSNVQSSPSPDEDEDEDPPKVCASVGGTCTNVCSAGYVAYNEDLLDRTCAQAYDTSVTLICCVPGDSVDEGEIDEDVSEEKTDLTKALSDYSIGNEQQSGMGYAPKILKGMEKLFAPSYAMGGAWIVFILTTVIVFISIGLHDKFAKKKKRL